MSKIGSIKVKIELEADEFKRELERVYALIEDLERRLQSLASVKIAFSPTTDAQ